MTIYVRSGTKTARQNAQKQNGVNNFCRLAILALERTYRIYVFMYIYKNKVIFL